MGRDGRRDGRFGRWLRRWRHNFAAGYQQQLTHRKHIDIVQVVELGDHINGGVPDQREAEDAVAAADGVDAGARGVELDRNDGRGHRWLGDDGVSGRAR